MLFLAHVNVIIFGGKLLARDYLVGMILPFSKEWPLIILTIM